MYVPAERNFISMVNKPDLIKDLPDALLGFLTEYDKAKQRIKSSLELPINHAQLEYNKQNDIVYVKGEDYKVKLMGSVQRIPIHRKMLYLVSLHLSESVKSQANSAQKMSSDEAKRFEAEVANIWNIPKPYGRATEDCPFSRFCQIQQIGICQHCRRTGTKPLSGIAMDDNETVAGF